MGSRWTQIAILVAVAVAAVLAVAVAGIALGGGGGSASRDEYQKTVVTARNQVEFALAKLGRVQTAQQLLEALEDAAVVLDNAAASLDEAGIADGLEDEHEKLVEALRGLSSEVSGTAATLRDPAFAETIPRLTSLSFPQWELVNRTLGELKEQGIDVELLARH
ncbi:MAG: hypothetical protein ACRDPV_13140 [Gaiellaceae bacterium]